MYRPAPRLNPGFISTIFTAMLLWSCSSPTPWIETPTTFDPDISVALPAPPVAPRITNTTEIHDVVLEDDYYWLRERENPAVLAYLEAENAYTEAVMAHTADLQETLFQEMIGRIQETDLSVPYRHDDFWYYSRTVEGEEYSIFCRKRGSLDADEEILLDRNALAEGSDYFDAGIVEISPDHQILAYGVDTDGSEQFTVYFKDLATAEVAPETLEGVSYSFVWGNDNQTVFFTTEDETHRPYRLHRYRLGDAPDTAEVIYQEDDDAYYLDVSKTRSEQFIVIGLDSAMTSERWVLDADSPDGEFQMVEPRQHGIEYEIEHSGDHFLITTNASDVEDRAVNFRLVQAPVETPDRSNWTELLPHRPDVQLVGVDAFAGFLAIYERESGLLKVRIQETASGNEHYVAFPEPVYSVSPSANVEFETASLRITYQSLVTPRSVFDYHLEGRQLELLKETPVLGGFDRTEYATERVFATAEDGTQVPISLVYRNDTALDGSSPMLLIGYGSYGYPYDPYFSSNRISVLDRGVVYGIAHIRGGGEMGRPWYEDGKLLNKRNTFTDFISCAEHLIHEGYTSSDRLAIAGGSAGGLLMGAVMNMRPDLFAVVVADVPFVDVINTMLDESIPLTVIEWEEWGNPNELEYFEYMMSYSPYDNVEATDYPHTMVTAGLNDPRVQYWEPAKWTARMRSLRTDDNTLILRTNMGAGHFGASGRYGRLRELAFEYAFILDHLGLGE